MNVTDYWPMAREYSVWNAAVAALQFWTAEPEAHVLSSVIEQSTILSFILHLHTYYTSSLMKYYSVTS